ncbi:MAG: CDP-alcohol phosphatidyltransferase family protein [Candidatus Bathyarchaeota archaeon]
MPDSIPWENPATIPPYTPTVLTLTRILLTPILLTLLRAASPLAPTIYLAACATDLLDGKAARRLGSSSAEGAVLDASADFLLIATGFTHYVLLGIASPLLLTLMTLSFLQYIHTISLPVRDVLGKHVGTVLYTLLGALILAPSTQVGAAVNVIGGAYVAAALIHRFQRIQDYYKPGS